MMNSMRTCGTCRSGMLIRGKVAGKPYLARCLRLEPNGDGQTHTHVSNLRTQVCDYTDQGELNQNASNMNS